MSLQIIVPMAVHSLSIFPQIMSTSAAYVFLLVISFCFITSCICKMNTTVFCPETEKQSLLTFKKSLKDPNKQLSSWVAEVDCCKWKGVVCDDFSGHVHELHLRCNSPLPFEGLSGEISPSILKLKHLAFLDLSQNFFDATIPSFIGSFTRLELLNLSNAGFYGKVPHSIGNLSNLQALDLNAYRYAFVDSHGNSRNMLDIDGLGWLSGLSELEYLNMNGVNLSKESDWEKVINSHPSLLQLHLKGCNILDSMASVNDVDSNSLTFLDLSSNNLQSSAVLKWVFRLRNLISLDLSDNSFQGPIPTISNSTKLLHLDLSLNQFNSTIPDWLYLCRDMESVSLHDNLLHGTISSAISNLTSLEVLDLSRNQLSGRLIPEITRLCKLRRLILYQNDLGGEIAEYSFGNVSQSCLGGLNYLNLWGNKLSGPIPRSLGNLSSLIVLNLQGNELSGNLPHSLGQLLNLEDLFIGHNMLDGVVTDRFFANLTNLLAFSAAWNHLSLDVRPNWIPPFQLSILRLGKWNLGAGSRIPSWLETQKNIYELDLFETGIAGSDVPSWFWEIYLLDLSHNNLHGEIPYIYNKYLYLNSNKFDGSLPPVGNATEELNLSDNLFSGDTSQFFCGGTDETHRLINLELGRNQLNGELPDCWEKWPLLKYLSLDRNSISGSIPDSVGLLAYLLSLNLRMNKLSGQIPLSLQNCTELLKVDLGDNGLDGSLPSWMGTSLANLKILILRSNKMIGEIPMEICHLNSLQILDLSDNTFSSIIPPCVSNFSAMATEKSLHKYGESVYSYSAGTGAFIDSASITTKGSELQYQSLLPLVTAIDLSRNNLSGDIPKELTCLVDLISLNLSENHLSGRIPESIGNMKSLESLDFSRNSLSGRIPSSLSRISSLSHLNVSYNNLTGEIPVGTQLIGLDASSFIGNDLCGLPLSSNCSSGGGESDDEDESGGSHEMVWFYALIVLGYAVGFSAVCTSMVLIKSWREAYYGTMEWMWNKICECVCVK